MPPAPSAMIRTTIRAVYIRFTTVYAGDADGLLVTCSLAFKHN
jgi:hypothetical protein